MWSGTQNGVYWGVVHFCEKRKRAAALQNKAKPAASQRKRADGAATKQRKKANVTGLFGKLEAITKAPVGGPIFDICPDIQHQVNAFLKEGIVNWTTS